MINIRDINPLEHITSDLAKSRFNYESILNGIVEWSNSKLDEVTVRLATDTEPYYVDYTFPTKQNYSGNTHSIADAGAEGMFSYESAYPISALYDPTASMCDTVKIRLTVNDTAGGTWELMASAVIYDEGSSSTATRDYCAGLYLRRTIGTAKVLCKTMTDVTKGTAWSTEPRSVTYPNANWMRCIEAYNPRNQTFYESNDEVMVTYNGSVYRIVGSIADRVVPSDSSGWTKVCDLIDASESFTRDYLYSDGNEFYMYKSDSAAKSLVLMPEEDADGLYWDGPVHYIYMFTISGSTALRWRVVTDIRGFIARLAYGSYLTGTPGIGMVANLGVHAGTTSDTGHKGVSIFDSCNYSLWPTSDSSIWGSTGLYTTNTSIPVTSTQEYTAKMIFHHSDTSVKSMNIINYDGPDLDQGLAIYLPVRDKVIVDGLSAYKEPCDGYTFEFLFRIWPKPEYNGKETCDLVINKAHIYVYSVESSDQLEGVAPIAKFSMARLTNFYVFAENVGVPNRPVLYKAKFVYSEKKHSWETYDYYQLPDHIFLSPRGFVDPLDRNSDTYGVETAGFPLYQDPFSGLDMSRVMVDSEYRNRM